MSIIHDALKKATKEKQGGSPPPPHLESQPSRIEINPRKKKERFNWSPIFVLAVLVLITAPIVAPIFSSPFKRVAFQHARPSAALNGGSAPLRLPAAVEGGLTRKGQFAVEEAPLGGNLEGRPSSPASLSGAPSLLLSGIVYSAQESYCIINDKIMKIGEEVSGAKLVKVTATEAVLDFQGRKIILYA